VFSVFLAVLACRRLCVGWTSSVWDWQRGAATRLHAHTRLIISTCFRLRASSSIGELVIPVTCYTAIRSRMSIVSSEARYGALCRKQTVDACLLARFGLRAVATCSTPSLIHALSAVWRAFVVRSTGQERVSWRRPSRFRSTDHQVDIVAPFPFCPTDYRAVFQRSLVADTCSRVRFIIVLITGAELRGRSEAGWPATWCLVIEL